MNGEYRKIEHTNFRPNEMLAAAAIAELAGAAQRIQRVSFRMVVLCEDCIIKKQYRIKTALFGDAHIERAMSRWKDIVKVG